MFQSSEEWRWALRRWSAEKVERRGAAGRAGARRRWLDPGDWRVSPVGAVRSAGWPYLGPVGWSLRGARTVRSGAFSGAGQSGPVGRGRCLCCQA
jgi:hypothetical protein